MLVKAALRRDVVVETALVNNLDEFSNLKNELIDYAKANNVPIIKKEGLDFLELIVKLLKPKKILEIGTAIGFSSIMMEKISDSLIYTIERDDKMYNEAIKNITKANYIDKIKVIHNDALLCYDMLKDESFDLIFIDAAKAQYIKFFTIYSPLLTKNGIIISDNMNFHDLVSCSESTYNSLSRSVRGLIRKLRDYRNFLDNNTLFDTRLFNIGDGMAVSVRKDV